VANPNNKKNIIIYIYQLIVIVFRDFI